jgi:hypothetical protein
MECVSEFSSVIGRSSTELFGSYAVECFGMPSKFFGTCYESFGTSSKSFGTLKNPSEGLNVSGNFKKISSKDE